MSAWQKVYYKQLTDVGRVGMVNVLSETPKTRYDPIQKAAKSENSLKLNNNTFEKSKLEFVALYYRYTDELPVSSE
ncbi:hypothetical protein Tco_0664015 [Tanacetum coccineum]